jgi:hypothetical protein
LALLLRLVFYIGVWGSDDLVYLSRAAEIANGEWSSAQYNGALRYGYNIPQAIVFTMFGVSESSANVWPLLASLLEIIVVWIYCTLLLGDEIALLSCLFLAFVPIAIISATTMHVDPVVSLFMSLSFVMVAFGERYRSAALLFLAGVAGGMVFWCRELVVFYLALFPIYAATRRFPVEWWLWFSAGGLSMLLLHLILMRVITGDYLHLLNVVLAQIRTDFVPGDKIDAPGFYLWYLFVEIRHAGVIAFIAVVGLLARSWPVRAAEQRTLLTVWGVGLIMLFSFIPISVDPLRFVTKQQNYLIMMITPLCIIAGVWAAAGEHVRWWTAVVLVVVSGLFLAGLEQDVRRSFVRNSKAVYAYVKAHPELSYYGTVNNQNVTTAFRLLNGDDGRVGVDTLGELKARGISSAEVRSRQGLVAIYDPVTHGWNGKDVELESPRPCWVLRQLLSSAPDNVGHLSTSLLWFGMMIAGLSETSGVVHRVANVHHPEPASLYDVPPADPWCQVGRASQDPTHQTDG